MRATILLLAGLLVAPVLVIGADFDVVSITSPPDTVRQATTWTPAATVHAASGNPDTVTVPVQMRIGLTYTKVAYPRLGPGQTLTVGFGTPWSADSTGSVAVRCSLLIPDANPANNLVTKTTVVLARKVDVAVQSVSTPTQARIGDSIVPTATIHAADSNPKPVTVTARLRIGDFYQDTASQMLGPGQTGGYAFKPWSPDTLGTFRVRCSLLVQDSTPANDTLGKDITVLARLVDFAPAAITTTPPIVHLNDTVVPTVAVRANAYNPTTETIAVRLQIGTRYTDTAAVALDPGDSSALAFGAWLADSAGTFQAYCSLLVQDSTLANDTLGRLLTVYPQGSDFEAVSILSPPDTVKWDSVVTPAVLVHAVEGNEAESVKVRLRIGSAYDDTTEAMIPAGQSQQVTFRDWQAESPGPYSVRCSLLTPDYDSTNDSLSKDVRVIDIGQPGGPPAVQWLKTFPGLGTSAGYWVRQTTDGGFIAAGVTGLDSPCAPGYYYVLRLDSVGDTLWTRTLSRVSTGNTGGIAYGIVQTTDGGFAVFGTDKGSDYCDQPYLVKLDSAGSVQWQSILYVDTLEYGSSVQQTIDGGFILAGLNTRSSTYLMKVDSVGTFQWRWTLHENVRQTWPTFVPVAQATDGGYVTTGHKDSFGLTLWKVDGAGAPSWRNTYSGEYALDGYGIFRTADGGFAITGPAGGPDRDLANRIYLLKVDSLGVKQWCRYFSERRWRMCNSVWQTADGGFIVAGAVGDNDGVYREDAFVLRTDDLGNEVWYKTLSPSTEDDGECVQQTLDGGYVICGGLGSEGTSHLLLLKLGPDSAR